MSLARLQSISRSEVMPQVEAFIRESQKVARVKKIILFGSLARNEMTLASDIDLAVLVDSKENLQEIKEQLRAIKQRSMNWPCDLVVCDLEWFESRRDLGGICFVIAREGQVLFDRSQEGEEKR